MRRYISFDWAIKSILRNKENYVVLEGLLSVLLDKKITIDKILESEKNKSASDEKLSRVDMLAEDEEGVLYLFEVQYLNQYDYFHRMLYSTSSVITERLINGEPYSNVKKVYSIHIVYFDLGEGSDYIYKGTTRFVGLNTNQELLLSERQKKQFNLKTIEDVFPTYFLLKLMNFKEKANTPIKEWVRFLKEGEIDDDTTVAGLKEAKDKLNLLRLPKEQRGDYNRYISNMSYQRSVFESAIFDGKTMGWEEGRAEGMEVGRAEGREEGRAEGREEGAVMKNIENARKMKEYGIPIEQIVGVTGLSEEEIERL